MKVFKDLLRIFYPKICVVCEQNLLEAEYMLCTKCRHDLPLTEISNTSDNKVMHAFYGKIAIESAYAFLWFRKNGPVQKIIHSLKYESNEAIGIFFGEWIGQLLLENKFFKDIDCIVPVPLHKKRKRKRGYNQVSKLCDKISSHLDVSLNEELLYRVSSTSTQTFKSRIERFSNVGTKFLVNTANYKDYQHILLVDDVVTTGATLEACAKVLIEQTGCKISVLALAYTE